MCPYCAVRGRQGGGGRPHGQSPAAAKISDHKQRRSSLVIHVDARLLHGAVRRETFCELNRRRAADLFSSVSKRFDADGAILSAQYDGLEREVQLTCGARSSLSLTVADHWRV